MRRPLIAAATALALLGDLSLGSPAFAEEAAAPYDVDTVLARVNGTEITLGELVTMVQGLPEQYRAMSDQTLFDAVLTQLVDQQVLADQVAAPPRSVQIALKNEKRTLLARVALQEILESQEITEAELQAAYDATYGGIEGGVEWSASHILVATREEAVALKVQLDQGADFAALAREHSTGPSGPNGGNLGWFGPGQMVVPFEDAVRGLAPGEVSEPVETQFGWHLIVLNDQRETSAPPLEAVREDLIQQLQNTLLYEELDRLHEAATIEIPDSPVPAAAMREVELLDD